MYIKGVYHVSRTGFSPFTVHRICVVVAVSSTNTKYFFIEKKLSAAQKLTANNEQCTATRLSRFRQQYFIRRKNNFIPYSSCLWIVYSGLYTFIENGLHPQKIGIRCTILRRRIVAHFFNKQLLKHYRTTIELFLASLDETEQYCWLQQDGATAQTVTKIMDFLKTCFDDCIISCGFWPLRSQKMTPLDHFLWRYVKKLSISTSSNFPHPLENITYRGNGVSYPIILRKVFLNQEKRVKAYQSV